jgi:uncharacterized peroxidase-related enzyme
MSTYLPGVAASPKPGPYRDMITGAQANGSQHPGIWDLFAFQNDVTVHLGRFTHGVIRQPGSISVGFRELIAAYTSYLNACEFCTHAHAAAASELLGGEAVVWSILRDPNGSSLDPHEKAMLRFVAKVTTELPSVTATDVQELRIAGWDDEAIYFAITTCALFNFYNRWITATGVPVMSPEAHREQGRQLATRGYTRG